MHVDKELVKKCEAEIMKIKEQFPLIPNGNKLFFLSYILCFYSL